MENLKVCGRKFQDDFSILCTFSKLKYVRYLSNLNFPHFLDLLFICQKVREIRDKQKLKSAGNSYYPNFNSQYHHFLHFLYFMIFNENLFGMTFEAKNPLSLRKPKEIVANFKFTSLRERSGAGNAQPVLVSWKIPGELTTAWKPWSCYCHHFYARV